MGDGLGGARFRSVVEKGLIQPYDPEAAAAMAAAAAERSLPARPRPVYVRATRPGHSRRRFTRPGLDGSLGPGRTEIYPCPYRTASPAVPSRGHLRPGDESGGVAAGFRPALPFDARPSHGLRCAAAAAWRKRGRWRRRRRRWRRRRRRRRARKK